MYKTKEKVLNELPPTSSTIYGNLLRSHYFMYLCSNLLGSFSKHLEPTNYGWAIETELLVPINKFTTVPSGFTTNCHCKKGYKKNCRCKSTFEKCKEYCDCRNYQNLQIFGADLVSSLMSNVAKWTHLLKQIGRKCCKFV